MLVFVAAALAAAPGHTATTVAILEPVQITATKGIAPADRAIRELGLPFVSCGTRTIFGKLEQAKGLKKATLVEPLGEFCQASTPIELGGAYIVLLMKTKARGPTIIMEAAKILMDDGETIIVSAADWMFNELSISSLSESSCDPTWRPDGPKDCAVLSRRELFSWRK